MLAILSRGILPILLLLCTLASAHATHMGLLATIQGGNVWVREVPDGLAWQLTTDEQCLRPRVSPSGRWTAYIHDDALVIQGSRGGIPAVLQRGRHLTTAVYGDTFAWSPTEDTLAYAASDGTLRLARWQNQRWRSVTLLGMPEGDVRCEIPCLTWAANGTRLACTQVTSEVNTPARAGRPARRARLYAIDPRRHVSHLLLDAGLGTYLPIIARWHGASTILYWANATYSASLLADGAPLYRISATGGAPREVTTTLAYPDFIATLRDDMLVLVAGGGRACWTGKRITLLAQSGKRALTASPASLSAISPAVSPDGATIAFVASPDTEATSSAITSRRIWLATARGQYAHPLHGHAGSREEYPRWSRDGRYLLFVRVDASGVAGVYLADRSGTRVRRIAGGIYTPRQRQDDPGFTGDFGHVRWNDFLDWQR